MLLVMPDTVKLKVAPVGFGPACQIGEPVAASATIKPLPMVAAVGVSGSLAVAS